ncbi:hypothetical protein SBOR_7422 [Sclerotinia borealis F-4128]|uniref:Uncharacterized protein n=1 Tax=Sclerotinia borealis (strain F-4128) TaxID=1432307 RepID=W9CBG4_SCLBF|nr:hypothetical protein SBOR_7422 [Sclerotinia borealis F-4128]
MRFSSTLGAICLLATIGQALPLNPLDSTPSPNVEKRSCSLIWFERNGCNFDVAEIETKRDVAETEAEVAPAVEIEVAPVVVKRCSFFQAITVGALDAAPWKARLR